MSWQKTTASSSNPPWQLLPDDILRTVFKNLWIGDRVRAGLVCKSWEHILTQDNIPKIPETPWQILADDSYDKSKSCVKEIRFKSITEKRIYRFQLSHIGKHRLADGWSCCGSSRGWLLIAVKARMFLWQPLSRDIRKLPPLSTLPFFKEFQVTGRIINLSTVIHRVEVFSVDSIDCIVAVIFRRNSTRSDIALCTPQEKTWKIFGGGEFEPCYSDILYHSTTKRLWVLASHLLPGTQPKDFSSYINILLTGCWIPVSMAFLPIDVTSIFEPQFPLGLQVAQDHRYCLQLVESALTQKIIVVIASLDCSTSKNGFDGEHIVQFRCQQTRGFNVGELVIKNREMEILSGIGEETIFLGATGSFSTPAVEGVETNNIYFATDDAEGLALLESENKHYIVREHGVFSLQHNKMEQTSSTTVRYPSESKVGWFTPELLKEKKTRY